MMPSQQGQQSPVDINRFQDGMINLVYNVCSIVTAPVEMVLRPQYGSRYFPPVIMFFTAVMMILLPLFAELAESAGRMLPFMRFRGGTGLFGIATFSKLYVFGSWYMQWQFLRGLMDMRNTGPIIAKFVDNTATDDDLATIHMASLPKNIPEDVRRDTASHIARAFSPAGSEFPR